MLLAFNFWTHNYSNRFQIVKFLAPVQGGCRCRMLAASNQSVGQGLIERCRRSSTRGGMEDIHRNGGGYVGQWWPLGTSSNIVNRLNIENHGSFHCGSHTKRINSCTEQIHVQQGEEPCAPFPCAFLLLIQRWQGHTLKRRTAHCCHISYSTYLSCNKSLYVGYQHLKQLANCLWCFKKISFDSFSEVLDHNYQDPSPD